MLSDAEKTLERYPELQTSAQGLRFLAKTRARSAEANITEGPVYRGVDRHNKVATTGLHLDSIAAIFKTAAARAGMNATNIAGDSVRARMATQAVLNRSSERAIAKTTRHKSRRVLRRYLRPGEMFRENASASLGL